MVAVYIRPNHLFLHNVTDEELCGRNVLHFNLFQLLRDCSTIAPPLLYTLSKATFQLYFYQLYVHASMRVWYTSSVVHIHALCVGYEVKVDSVKTYINYALHKPTEAVISLRKSSTLALQGGIAVVIVAWGGYHSMK